VAREDVRGAEAATEREVTPESLKLILSMAN
jgi:hypothetical protein